MLCYQYNNSNNRNNIIIKSNIILRKIRNIYNNLLFFFCFTFHFLPFFVIFNFHFLIISFILTIVNITLASEINEVIYIFVHINRNGMLN